MPPSCRLSVTNRPGMKEFRANALLPAHVGNLLTFAQAAILVLPSIFYGSTHRASLVTVLSALGFFLLQVLKYKIVAAESVTFIRGFGIQVVAHRWNGRTSCKDMICVSEVEDILIAEVLQAYNVRLVLTVVVRGRCHATLLFEDCYLRTNELLEVWRGAHAVIFP